MHENHDTVVDITGRIVFEILRLNGRLLAAGNLLVGDLGLTSARWQVLSVAAFNPAHETVSGIAHNLGLARQSVQRVANELVEAGLVDLVENPNHKRARLVVPTKAGRVALADAEKRRLAWTKGLAANLNAPDVSSAASVLTQLRATLDRLDQSDDETHA